MSKEKQKPLVRSKIRGFDWNYFKEYVATYDPKKHGANDKRVILKDMLYGLGVASSSSYKMANGFRLFKKYLVKFILK